MKRILKPKYVNDTALDILRREGVFLCADCGGRGTCGKCRVRVINDEYQPKHDVSAAAGGKNGLNEPSDEEKKVLSESDISSGIRLACCLKVGEAADAEKGIKVEIPDSSIIPDTFGDTEKELDELLTADDSGEAEDGGQAGAGDLLITKLEPLEPSEIIAVDYGTTVLCGAVVDLNLGIRREASVVNHQKAYGADVLSRIRAANSGYLEELRHVSEDDLAELSIRLGKDPDLARYIISGNTVMGHLISGFSCKGLGEYPYKPVDISLRRDGNMTFLPGISAFVGADIVSGICASSLDQTVEPWLYVDIGTNGEMALGNGGDVISASVPAGPAFEGGSLSCGVPAVPGAVSEVVVAGTKSIASVIGGNGTKPIGICGSGVIDAAAELLKNRIMDENGTFVDEYLDDGFPIVGDVVITQKDMREIQKAKAAIRAGIETLIAESGMAMQDIRKLVIAGTFGSSINMDNAARIGLIPEELLPVSGTVGNSSLTGATLYALDTGFGARLQKFAGEARSIDLSEVPSFSARYISHMGF